MIEKPIQDEQVQETGPPKDESLFDDLESREINYYEILNKGQENQASEVRNPQTGEIQQVQQPDTEAQQQLPHDELLAYANAPTPEQMAQMQQQMPNIDPKVLEDASFARKIFQNPELVEHIKNFYVGNNNSGQGGSSLPEPPEAPRYPANYDPQDAITDPNSESARYMRAFQKYQHETQEYYSKSLQAQAQNAERERQMYKEREAQREAAFNQQIQQREQFAIQQETQAREVANLRAKHGMSDAEIVEFVQWVKNPEVLADTDHWVTAFRNNRQNQPAQYQAPMMGSTPMNPVSAGGEPVPNTYQGSLQDRYPRSPTMAGRNTAPVKPPSVLDNLFGGLKDLSDKQTQPFLVKTS